MPEHSLDELRKLATPALRHAELVQIARTKRPNEARTTAHNAGWPRRQVRAVKFLATLVRDYGTGALEALITSMEQVRAATSAAPEQAREKRKMTDRIRDRLNLIDDPKQKFEFMLRNGMTDDATALVEQFIGEQNAFLWFNESGGGICNPLFATKRTDALKHVVLVCHREPEMMPLKYHNSQIVEVSFDLGGMIEQLKWDEERTHRVVRTVLTKNVALPVESWHYWMVQASQRVVRHFLPVEDTLAVQVERHMLLQRFRDYRLFDLRSTALPVPAERNTEGIEAELDPIVDRFLALGYTMEEVRQEFLKWIRDRENPYLNYYLMIGSAKCFPDQWDDDLHQAMRPALPKLWEEVVRCNDDGKTLDMFVRVGGAGLFRASGTRYIPAPERTPHPVAAVKGAREPQPRWEPYEGDEEFFHGALVQLLGKGEAAKVYQLLTLLGHRMGLLREGKGNHNTPAAFMASIAPAAFQLAYSEKRFGTAAALSQHFNCVDEQEARRKANEEFREEVATILGDHVREEDAGDLNMSIDTTPADEDGDEDTAKEQQMVPLRKRRDERLAMVLDEQRQQMREVVQVAFDLEQPIKLEFMSYHWLPGREAR